MKNPTQNRTTRRSNARRRLLKATLMGGGAAATVASLPERWAKPAIDSAVLPAHAQTSGEHVTGIYTATGVGSLALNQPVRRGIQYALLDALIPAANANHIVGGICGSDNDDAPSYSPATIMIRINANSSVDIAVSTATQDSSPCGAATTINPDNTIDDVLVQLDDDEFLNLTNMVASTSQVTGNWATEAHNDGHDDSDICNGSFTAPKGGSFPSTNACTD